MSHESKGVCQRCGGSGQLLRPAKIKLLNFKRCTDCGGRGYRFKATEVKMKPASS